MVNLTQLRQLYTFTKDLSFEDIKVLLKAAKKIKLKKKDSLINEGSKNKEVFFVQKGLIRCFHINKKGDEITFNLFAELQIIANVDNILYGTPSKFHYEAIERSILFSIDFDILQEIISDNPKLEANRKFIFRKILKKVHLRIESFVLMSPEERYLWYIETYPNIVNRVPNKFIAHILGITPVSLSRIRRRIAEK